jgi:hypothetical protein
MASRNLDALFRHRRVAPAVGNLDPDPELLQTPPLRFRWASPPALY